jgi:hypothetical protein
MGKTKFALYYTLNKNIPEKPLSVKQKTDLVKFLRKVEEIDQIILLITEHAIINDNYVPEVENPNLPYDGYDDGKTTTFDLDNLPTELQWILHKFSKLPAGSA